MNNNYTHIVLLVDASGSMGATRQATIDGINTFINSQKTLTEQAPERNLCFDDDLSDNSTSHQCTITLCTFASDGRPAIGINGEPQDAFRYTKIYDAEPINNVQPLTLAQYICEGGTPLIDAYYKAITECSGFINRMSENNRPGRVIIISNTDGEENTSTKYNREQLRNLITEKTALNWQFVYLGANQDAFNESSLYGVQAGQALNYTQTSRGIVDSFSYLSSNILEKRMCDVSMMSSCSISEFDKTSGSNNILSNQNGSGNINWSGTASTTFNNVSDLINQMEEAEPTKSYSVSP